MAEWNLDAESIKRAEVFSSRLMDDFHRLSERGASPELRLELFSRQPYSEFADGVPVDDVVTNVGQMAKEFAMARRWDGGVPCLKPDDGVMAPISLAEFFGGGLFSAGNSIDLWDRYYDFPGPHRFWRELFDAPCRMKTGSS